MKHKYSKQVPRVVTAMRKERWKAGDKYHSAVADNSYETNSLNSGSEPEVSTQTEQVCEICARKRKMEEDPNLFTRLICR